MIFNAHFVETSRIMSVIFIERLKTWFISFLISQYRAVLYTALYSLYSILYRIDSILSRVS